MKKTLRDTGATGKKEADYFQITRTSDPIESYGIKEFRKRVAAQQKKKAQKQKPGDNS
jgi:hypothetical protein